MKIVDLLADQELLKIARREAFALIKNDPHLRNPEYTTVRENLVRNYSEYMTFINVL
jgi:hypothetical protein